MTNPKFSELEFPDELFLNLENELHRLGYSFDRPAGLADAVMRLSGFYLNYPTKQTPWHESWCQAAYLTYFMPLNWWRMTWAIRRGIEVGFFEGLDHYIDFGSGLGSAAFAFAHLGIDFSGSKMFVERSKEAIALHQRLQTESDQMTWQSWSPDLKKINKRTLAVFSYSLTEVSDLPNWAETCDAVMIVEPATQDDGRKLMKLRQSLIDRGWKVAAPCTHQSACPLLIQSERDWCHDRCLWQQPDWLNKVERLMPIKNGTLPFSYLMVRKDAKMASDSRFARITGDLQEFKGYAKQLICRNSEREFTSWQKRDFGKSYPDFLRGDLVKQYDDIEKKGNELRPTRDQIRRP